MQNPQKKFTDAGRAKFSLIVVALGIVALALFLVYQRSGWFHVRPATGTAAAMALAADKPAEATPAPTR